MFAQKSTNLKMEPVLKNSTWSLLHMAVDTYIVIKNKVFH